MSSGHGDGNNRKTKECNWWCAACGGQYDWRAPNRLLVRQDSVDPREANVFRAHGSTARTVLQFDQLAEALDESAERRGQPGGKYCYRFPGEESQRYHGRAQEVH